MEFHRLEYLTFNSSTVSYLYIICAAIFDIDSETIIITHSPTVKTVKSLDEEDDDDDDVTRMAWPAAEDEDQIKKGKYYIIFDEDAGIVSSKFIGRTDSASRNFFLKSQY
jgi:hypothetical protein